MVSKIIEMKWFSAATLVLIAFLACIAPSVVEAQPSRDHTKSQEVSEADGIPVLLKHLPDWESVSSRAVFASDRDSIRAAAGGRPVVDLIDFTPGTEAASAVYPAGQLLIIEFPSPQQSVEADTRFRSFLEQNSDGRTVYRRIGNYNAFVFGVSDADAANALLDQVRYEKNIQWLGEDPFLFERLERNFVVTTSDLFISTVEVIVLGMLFSIIGGLVVGFVFFQLRERRRASMKEFSDAGGMTRLNLDGFTPEISTSRLLEE